MMRPVAPDTVSIEHGEAARLENIKPTTTDCVHDDDIEHGVGTAI